LSVHFLIDEKVRKGKLGSKMFSGHPTKLKKRDDLRPSPSPGKDHNGKEKEGQEVNIEKKGDILTTLV